jgi:hypothetical protein
MIWVFTAASNAIAFSFPSLRGAGNRVFQALFIRGRYTAT